MARSFPPPRRNLTSPIARPTEPAIPTEAEYAMITINLGIAPSHDKPHGRLADELHYSGNVAGMIDALSSPADAAACERHAVTPSQWHNTVTSVLGYAAWRYKRTLPLTDAEIEMMIEPAAPALRDRLRVMLRGGMNLIPALKACESDDEAAIA